MLRTRSRTRSPRSAPRLRAWAWSAIPNLQTRLLAVLRDDIARLDRLITDIAEASRLDAELSRTRFELVDLGRDHRVAGRRARGARSQRQRPDRLRSTSYRPHGDGAGRRIAAGPRVREFDRQRDLLLAGRAAWSRWRRRATATRWSRASMTRGRACPPMRDRRSSGAFTPIARATSRSVATPAWGLRSPRRSWKVTTARSTCATATTAAPGARFIIRLPVANL